MALAVMTLALSGTLWAQSPRFRFAPPVALSTAQDATPIAIADFDRDGDLDIATATGGGFSGSEMNRWKIIVSH